MTDSACISCPSIILKPKQHPKTSPFVQRVSTSSLKPKDWDISCPHRHRPSFLPQYFRMMYKACTIPGMNPRIVSRIWVSCHQHLLSISVACGKGARLTLINRSEPHPRSRNTPKGGRKMATLGRRLVSDFWDRRWESRFLHDLDDIRCGERHCCWWWSMGFCMCWIGS